MSLNLETHSCSLKFFSQPEGYVEPDGTGNFDYIYQYKDHLGNIRLSYRDNNGTLEVLEENNYYPFGLEHKGYNSAIQGVKNNIKTYQSQEFTEDLGLNTHEWRYRVSDPAIGRFWQMDPCYRNCRKCKKSNTKVAYWKG